MWQLCLSAGHTLAGSTFADATAWLAQYMPQPMQQQGFQLSPLMIVSTVIGTAGCIYLAKIKDKSIPLWGIVGFLLGLLGLAIMGVVILMDSKSKSGGQPGGQSGAYPPYVPSPPAPPAGRQWYFAANGQTQGPYDEGTMIGMVQRREVARGTQVWAEGMPSWQSVETVEPLRAHVG